MMSNLTNRALTRLINASFRHSRPLYIPSKVFIINASGPGWIKQTFPMHSDHLFNVIWLVNQSGWSGKAVKKDMMLDKNRLTATMPSMIEMIMVMMNWRIWWRYWLITSGMLNSFNSGAFQISCLRWAHAIMILNIMATLSIIPMILFFVKSLTMLCQGLSTRSLRQRPTIGREFTSSRILKTLALSSASSRGSSPSLETRVSYFSKSSPSGTGATLRYVADDREKMKGVVRNLCGVEWVGGS